MIKAAKESKKSSANKEKVIKRSAADFFQDNKAIAGFDNSMRVVFTSIRELVENGLDAAERVGKLPELYVTIQKLTKEEIARLLNVSTFEASEKIDFIRLTVRDNGSGVQSEFIPPLFGRVLTGSNYGARQSRGRFGLGAKMVLLNAMSSVDLPLIIKSKHYNEDFTSYHELMINLAENEPIILVRREIPQEAAEAIIGSGTEVTVTFTGSWNLASRYIYEYFSQLSLITPYANFYIRYPDSETPVIMKRVVEEMPPYPQIAKVHPWGTDITQFKREQAITRSTTIEQFLQDHFQGIGPKTAQEFLDFVQISYDKDPKQLSSSEIRRIVHEGFVMPDSDLKKRRQQKYFPFKRPSGDSLAPLGSDFLAKGVTKELSPQFIRADSGEISAYSGHPFVVEAALAYGGPNLSGESGNPKIYRFANRIPLLFGAGNDIITKCVQKMAWKNYKININKSPIAIVVSIVSSKIPFPETSKEYIADVDELREEIVRVLRKLARGLSRHLGKAERERRESQRQSRFESAAPKVLQNISQILKDDETPFILQSPEEFSKLEKALASAVPRFIRRKFPPSLLISDIGEWLPMETYISLIEHNIQTIFQFLRAPITDLCEITNFSEEYILEIKRATVNSQKRIAQAPTMKEFEIFPKIIDNDFIKFRGAQKIHRALGKRWIVSSLGFFATPVSQLRYVEYFPEKLLYEAKMKTIMELLNNNSNETFEINTIPWITNELIKSLKSIKIHNTLEYLLAFPEKLSAVPSLSIKLVEGIKKEIQEGIDKGYIDSEKVIGAATFNWMDYRVTPRLRGRKISKIKEFMQTPTEKLIELPELVENLINQSKSSLKDKLSYFNNNETLLMVPGIQEEMLSDLTRLEIAGFIDFLLTEEKDLQIIRGLVNNLIMMKQDEILAEIEQNFESIPIKNAYWLDSALEKEFQELGIKTVYDFIRTPSSRLQNIKSIDLSILTTIKKTYGTPIPFITPEEKNKLEVQQILCLEELPVVVKYQKLIPKSFCDRMKELLDLLEAPICYLPIPSKYYQILHHIGISRIFDFQIWPENDLHHKTGIPYKLIEEIKSEISPENIKNLIESKSLHVSILENNLKSKSWEKLFESNLTVQQLYYNLPYSYSNDLIKKFDFSSSEIEHLNQLFNTPISEIQQIRSKWIENFHSKNINTFIDLITWSRDEIGSIIGRDLNFVKNFVNKFDEFILGMPLIDLGVFSTNEMKILSNNGFKSIESVYFSAKKETFHVKGIKWKKIERFQRILETPIAMLQLQSTAKVSEIRITHDGLEKLSSNGIDQIIKLIYWNNDELKTILNMSLQSIENIKKSIAIKEQGMPLEKVTGYNRKILTTLINYGIETVEDLYFSASEDMLDEEEDDINWSYVKKAIEALDLPIKFLSGVIAAKYVDKLTIKKIDSIIRFLITSTDELSEILKTPTENIENLKEKINLIRLRESTETSVSILEGLHYKQLQKLAEEGISTIFDFLTASNEQIANTLDLQLDQVAVMKNNLNFDNIKAIKEEKMVPLTKISLLNKNIVKQLARFGIESLADLYYVATPQILENSDIDWQEIQDAKIILDLPIEVIPEINDEEVNVLNSLKVKMILDLLMQSLEEPELIVKIPMERIKVLQDSINSTEILNLIKQLNISLFDFPSEYKGNLHREEINTIYELLSHPNEDLFLLKEGDKKLRIKKESWKNVLTILAIPLGIVMGTDREIVKKLKQRHIDKLRDVLSFSRERIESILGSETDGFLEELRTVSFRDISQFLEIPICFIPSITVEWIQLLLNQSIKRIKDILQKDSRELSSILLTSLPKVRSFLSEITIPNVIKNLEKEAVSLNIFSEVIPSITINILMDKGITSVQELLLHARKELKGEGLNDLYEILDAPINRLSEKISLKNLRILSQNKISTISQWYFAPNMSLTKIIDIEESEIEKIKINFEIKSTMDVAESTIPLTQFIESGYIDFEDVRKLGISTLEDLIFVDLKSLETSDQLKTRLNNLKDALNSSLAYYSQIPAQYVVALAFNGVTSITQLIRTNYNQLENTMGIIAEDDYNHAKKSLNLVEIITNKKTDSEFRVKLATLKAFTPNQLTKIQELGFDNVVDLYFLLDIEKCPKSIESAVESVKKVLEKPVALLPIIQENFPQKILLLFNAGITSIIEFLFWPKNDLAELLEIKKYEISKYRKIDIGTLKRKRNLGTPIENLVRLPEQYVPKLQEIGIDNIEDLFFYYKRYPDLINEEIVPQKILKECIKNLESPIVQLAELPIPAAQELVRIGVNRIIDFLYWPENDMKGIRGLSSAMIKRIKFKVRVRRKSDVIGRLDSYWGD